MINMILKKALLDDRMLDLDLSELLLSQLVHGIGSTHSPLDEIASIDREMVKALEDEAGLIGLDYCLPGTDFVLPRSGHQSDGDDDVVVVTHDNVHSYVEAVAKTVCREGVQQQIDAMRRGFSKIFDVYVFFALKNVKPGCN